MNPIRETARRRLIVAGGVALLGVAAVAVRLVTVSLWERDRWAAEAERQQQRTVRLDPERGTIRDREGRELAVSVSAWSAFADPSAFADDPARDAAAAALATWVMSMDVPDLSGVSMPSTPRRRTTGV